MNALYAAIGISKQAVHRYAARERQFEEKLRVLIAEAELLRAEHPGCGLEKMYYTLRPDFIGRDRFIDFFMALGFRVKQRKNRRRTTYSTSVDYPNLIKGMQLNGPNVVWQSDITYIAVGKAFYYAVFIVDVYTKEIVGYSLSTHLRATANLRALKNAFGQYGAPQIHHSDRGRQYIYHEYIALLESHSVAISMAMTAQENAYAERIHRTIKEEYLSHWHIQTFSGLRRAVKKAVRHYNTQRLHNHLGRKTPAAYRQHILALPEPARPTMTIYPESGSTVASISPHDTHGRGAQSRTR